MDHSNYADLIIDIQSSTKEIDRLRMNIEKIRNCINHLDLHSGEYEDEAEELLRLKKLVERSEYRIQLHEELIDSCRKQCVHISEIVSYDRQLDDLE